MEDEDENEDANYPPPSWWLSLWASSTAVSISNQPRKLVRRVSANKRKFTDWLISMEVNRPFFWVATIHCPFPIECPKPYAWFSNLHAGVLVLAFEFSGKGLLSFTIHIPMIIPIGQKPSLKAPLAPRQSLHSLQVAPPWWWFKCWKWDYHTWWLIPLSKWVITPVISGLTLLIPFITGVITHLLSGMSHQVRMYRWNVDSFFGFLWNSRSQIIHINPLVSMIIVPRYPKYHLVMTNSSPWKITILSLVNHLFLWAIYTMAMLNNQRVYRWK